MHAPKSDPSKSDPSKSDPSKPDPSELADVAADVLARLRAKNPRVHCITNAVAQNFTANVLLAAGAGRPCRPDRFARPPYRAGPIARSRSRQAQ